MLIPPIYSIISLFRVNHKCRLSALEKRVRKMKIGYACVSSSNQNLDRQMEVLERAGAEKSFQEKMSEKSMTERLELKKLFNFFGRKIL